MTITLQEIIQASSAFEVINKEFFTGAISFQIVKLIKQLDKEIANFESVRDKMIEKYAARDENGNIQMDNDNIIIDSNNVNIYNKEISELLNIPIEIDFNPLPAELLNNINLTPMQAYTLSPFFE